MRIAAFSDIHGNLTALEAVPLASRLSLLASRFSLLTLSPPLIAHRDRRLAISCYLWLKAQLTPEQHAYLLGLPFQQCIGPVLGVHGSPRSFSEGMLPDTPEEELALMVVDVPVGIEVVLGGHVHHPLQGQVGRLTIVGVGSVGLPADGDPRPCYALLERTPNGWRVQWPRPTYDVEAAIAAAWRSGQGLA